MKKCILARQRESSGAVDSLDEARSRIRMAREVTPMDLRAEMKADVWQLGDCYLWAWAVTK